MRGVKQSNLLWAGRLVSGSISGNQRQCRFVSKADILPPLALPLGLRHTLGTRIPSPPYLCRDN
jgi:hypothetical protein